MNKLEKLAKRISEIGCEIKELKSQREVNLQICHKSPDDAFEKCKENRDPFDLTGKGNCLQVAFDWYKEDKENGYDDGFSYCGEFYDYNEVIQKYGCKNCIGAYEEKRAIGVLKQERGRIVGNISRIGQSL